MPSDNTIIDNEVTGSGVMSINWREWRKLWENLTFTCPMCHERAFEEEIETGVPDHYHESKYIAKTNSVRLVCRRTKEVPYAA